MFRVSLRRYIREKGMGCKGICKVIIIIMDQDTDAKKRKR